LTIEMKEPVNLIDVGNKIDPALLSVDYLKNSEEDVRMTNWEVLSYSEKEIHL
jgi:hypothetical protein